MFKNKQKKRNLKSGFTLIELLVTIVIFVLLTGVVLVNKNNFDNAELLNNFTYDVALTIKEAQSYSVNVQENNIAAFNTEYGVYFNLNTAIGSGGSNTNFILFNDLPNANTGMVDYKYDSVSGGVTTCLVDNPECIQKYSIRNGLAIKYVCASNDGTESSCDRNHLNELSILFKRPSFEARIYNPSNISLTPAYNYAKIVLVAPNGATSSVVVTDIGQIYVKK